MNKYTYKKDFKQRLHMTYKGGSEYDCFVSDSFQAFAEAAGNLAMKERRIVLIAEKHYSEFYSNDLSEILGAAGKTFDLYEIIGEVKDFAEEADKIAKAVEPVGLTACDCIVALGGHVADVVTRCFALASVKIKSTRSSG